MWVPRWFYQKQADLQRSKFNFQNMVMFHIKWNGITNAAKMVTNILPPDPRHWGCPPPPPPPQKVEIHFFFQKMVMLRITKIESQMQQNGSKYFACRPPLTFGVGSKVKIQLFQNMVMFHIKLNGTTNAGEWSQNVKVQLFQNMVMLHINLKGIEHHRTYFLLTHTLNLWVLLKSK